VREQHRVQTPKAFADRLQPEFGSGVDEYPFAAAPAEVNRRPQPRVAGIVGPADRTIAGYHGDSVGGAGAQHGYFHYWVVYEESLARKDQPAGFAREASGTRGALAKFLDSVYFYGVADAELVRVLDYILNRSGAAEIEPIAAAVVRRKRDLAMFGDAGVVDPARWAKKAAADLTASAGASLDAVRGTVRNMAADMLRKEAPELTEAQLDELLGAWIPSADESREENLPADVLLGMARQFAAFSRGTMSAGEDAALRKEMGEWPKRYWESFPPVLRSVIADYVRGGIDSGAFELKLRAAAELC
jgi:hypothetical protein